MTQPSRIAINNDSQCIVCAKDTIKSMRFGNIRVPTAMVLHKGPRWFEHDIYYWTVKDPPKRFVNYTAKSILNTELVGIVLLWSPQGLTVSEVKSAQDNSAAPKPSAAVPPPPNWSSLTKALTGPLEFSLSERLQQKLEKEARELERKNQQHSTVSNVSRTTITTQTYNDDDSDTVVETIESVETRIVVSPRSLRTPPLDDYDDYDDELYMDNVETRSLYL